jgi:hypothetical protein
MGDTCLEGWVWFPLGMDEQLIGIQNKARSMLAVGRQSIEICIGVYLHLLGLT